MKIRRAYELEEALNKRLVEITREEEHEAETFLADLEEKDPVRRRLAIARSQVEQSRLCYWGLPNQAVIWAYQGLDNSIHAALLATNEKVSTNHLKKLEAFLQRFSAARSWDANELSSALETWKRVRYERVGVSRDAAQRLVCLAETVHDFCSDIVTTATGSSETTLNRELEAIADRAGLPLSVVPEIALEKIDAHNTRMEDQLESMGLTGMGAQMAHGGRDLFLNLTANQAWARRLLADDPDVAERIRVVHESVFELTNALVEKRLTAMFTEDAESLAKPDRVAEASNFDLSVSVNYAGHGLLREFRRILRASGKALRGTN